MSYRSVVPVLPWVFAAVFAPGCGEPAVRSPDATVPTLDAGRGDLASGAVSDAESGTADAGGDEATQDARAIALARCRPPEGASGAPGTIAAALTLINALPHPVTLNCFVESLDRPLRIAAANSIFSLQPAVGIRSPRLFGFYGNLVFSIVLDGIGSALIEFGEFVDDLRTVKGEVAFPVEGILEPAAPYQRVKVGPGATNCGVCHAGELPMESIDYPDAFVSDALRPVDVDRIDLSRVRQEYEICDPVAEPNRCALLRSIFAHGPVEPWEFPAALPTFF